ncbi:MULTISPECIES: hypothetical protein [unclassified Streptomyces]|uniref:hypothetical protein n=1 Tax=unclassified Streptomyces TaxID=2593676 RepID=UPI0037188C96
MPTLTCYRGERSQFWGTPELRLCDGLTVRNPLLGPGPKPQLGGVSQALGLQVWAAFQKKVGTEVGISKKMVNTYAMALKLVGRDYALAAARTTKGSYDHYDCNYEIEVPNARSFLWGENMTRGAEVPDWIENPAAINANYLVLDADSFEESTVLAFGHHVDSSEVTFFTDIPTGWIKKVNGRDVSTVTVKQKKEFDSREKNLMRLLVRPPNRF